MREKAVRSTDPRTPNAQTEDRDELRRQRLHAKTSRSVLTDEKRSRPCSPSFAALLQMVRDDWANQSGELVAALNFNQKVWTILATSATDPANELRRT